MVDTYSSISSNNHYRNPIYRSCNTYAKICKNENYTTHNYLLHFHKSNHADEKYMYAACRLLHKITQQQIITFWKRIPYNSYTVKNTYLYTSHFHGENTSDFIFIRLGFWQRSLQLISISLCHAILFTTLLPLISLLRSCSNTVYARLERQTKIIISLSLTAVITNLWTMDRESWTFFKH